MQETVLKFQRGSEVKKARKKIIFAMYGNRCVYCLEKFPLTELTRDHIIPRCKGGNRTWQNIAPACKKCNGEKDKELLRSEQLTLLIARAKRYYEAYRSHHRLILEKNGKIYEYDRHIYKG